MGRAEKEGMQEPPETCYLPEKALGKGLGGHQSEVGALESGRAPVAPLHGGAKKVKGHVGGWWGPLQDLEDGFILQGGGSRRWERGPAGINLAPPASGSSPKLLVTAQLPSCLHATAGDLRGHLAWGSQSPQTQTQALLRVGTSAHSLGTQETRPCTARPVTRLWRFRGHPKSSA